jgi:hypothetical protein
MALSSRPGGRPLAGETSGRWGEHLSGEVHIVNLLVLMDVPKKAAIV